ncbi:uncharacterized protein C2845_PM03G33160 [Panicum miliaceum]|uniref:Uncharacterized protein n=1 Tax=Panicum miliaceum TaxID=4540 RepID=A0A3L6TAM9_PANMI|nr:uncharacterized protein C2845_PM03G33160 [Panicum miliaceum]
MAAARSGVMSEEAYQNTYKGLEKIIRENKKCPSRHRTKREQWPKTTNNNDLSSCSEGEDVNDEHQMNGMDATEPDHIVAGVGSVMDVMGPSNKQGMTTNKGKAQLDDSSYGAQANAIDDSMISRVPPALAKPQGRKMSACEMKEVTLGAKGEKEGTRKCGVCDLYAPHNKRTCLQLQHNRERLEAMQHRQRGRPPGAKNKTSAMQHDGVHKEHETGPATRRGVMPKNQYSEWDNDSESADDMDL